MAKWFITMLNNPRAKLLLTCRLYDLMRPLQNWDFFFFSSSSRHHYRNGRKRNVSSTIFSHSFFSSFLAIANPIREISLLSVFLFFSTSIAGVFSCVHLLKPKEKKSVHRRRRGREKDADADDGNNNSSTSSRCRRRDSRPRLVVIFFIPELLLAKSC